MQLKTYQETALGHFSGFLEIVRDVEKRVAKARAALEAVGIKQDLPDVFEDAWNLARSKGVNASLRQWVPLKSSAGYAIPHICIKLPTGGGKTFVAAHAVDRLLTEHLSRQTGFRAVGNALRRDLSADAPPASRSRSALQAGTGTRVWRAREASRKARRIQRIRYSGSSLRDASDAASRQPQQVDEGRSQDQERLRLVSLVLSGARRQDRAQCAFSTSAEFERNDLGGEAGGGTVKSSLENVLRIVRPVVVLDEGHKAYSDQARATIANLNPSFVLELSATPKPEHSNILINV